MLFWPFFVFDFAETSIYTFTWQRMKDWFLRLLFWPFVSEPTALDWCSRHVTRTDFMDVHQFYFWIPVCRAVEGSNAFNHLAVHRRPVTAANTQMISSIMLSIRLSSELNFSLQPLFRRATQFPVSHVSMYWLEIHYIFLNTEKTRTQCSWLFLISFSKLGVSSEM